MILADKIIMLRKKNGWSQEDLAEKMGVSRQTVSKWEMDAAFPEMEKAIALSRFFNCSLDELMKEDMNSSNKAYSDIKLVHLEPLSYVRYAVISPEPEDDAINHMERWAKKNQIERPDIVGWDFPFVSQEQTNVFHMHGYCAACILPVEWTKECPEVIKQGRARYAVITIENPTENPFVLIPNAYKTIFRYIEVNGLKHNHAKEVMECFEKEYVHDGKNYMDVYIAVCD